MGDQSTQFGAGIVSWIIIAAIVLFRASRPQRTSVTRMWISAGILMLLAVFAIVAGEMRFSAPAWEIALALAVGAGAGIPIGMLRGHHTRVSATDRHGVMELGASWATAGIYLGAFVLRGVVRMLMPATSPLGAVIGDGLLAFAIAIIAVTYLTVYRKYEALDHALPEATG